MEKCKHAVVVYVKDHFFAGAGQATVGCAKKGAKEGDILSPFQMFKMACFPQCGEKE